MLVQIGLVVISESITFFINSSANQTGWDIILILSECCRPFFRPTIDVAIGTFYPLIDGRNNPLTKRNGIVGGAISVLLSNLVGFSFFIADRTIS